jgi:inosine-uridine nucleoside N-ribohydrolase
VNTQANKGTPIWSYDTEESRLAQKLSAARVHGFLGKCGINDVEIFDGGIAPSTLVPHHVHFPDYIGFEDVDPLSSFTHSHLQDQDKLAHQLSQAQSFSVVVGGPMTGLAQLLQRSVRGPDASKISLLAEKISEVHAMFASWGNIQLMPIGDAPRGSEQFNVACDPLAAYVVLMGLECPIYLLPSDVTRVSEIGFQDTEELRASMPSTPGADELVRLYEIWYKVAVKPRAGERIYIHDLAPALSLHPQLREEIYEMVPVQWKVPHLPSEAAEWGRVIMAESQKSNGHFAAKSLRSGGAERYLQSLYSLFR